MLVYQRVQFANLKVIIYLQLIYPLKIVIFHSFLYVYQAG